MNKVGQVEALLFLDLPVDNFVGKLAKADDLVNPWVFKMVQQKRLSPQVFEKIVLLENSVVHKEKVEE
jgi:hypothetical protein